MTSLACSVMGMQRAFFASFCLSEQEHEVQDHSESADQKRRASMSIH